MTGRADTVDQIITERAVHFGRGDRHGGWVFAADVACCVEPGTGSGGKRRSGANITSTDSGKVSAHTFADRAGTTPQTVMKYLRAWELAAGRGLVDPAGTLVPGSDPELPPAEDWEAIYKDPDGPFAQPRRRAPAQPPPAPAPVVPPVAPPRLEPIEEEDDDLDPVARRGQEDGGRVRSARHQLRNAATDLHVAAQVLGALWEPCSDRAAAGLRADITVVQGQLDAILELIGGAGEVAEVTDEALRRFLDGEGGAA